MTPTQRKTFEYWRARMPATFEMLCLTQETIKNAPLPEADRQALISQVHLLCRTMAGEIDDLHEEAQRKRTEALSGLLGSVFQEAPPARAG